MTKILQDDANFLVEVIDWHGQPAIKKTAKPTAEVSRAARLKNDVLGMQFFAELAEQNPSLSSIYIPKFFDSGADYYIREYVDAQQLITNDMDFATAKPRIDQLVELLVEIDKIKTDQNVGYVGSSNYRNLAASIPRWADENVADKIITRQEGQRAKEVAEPLQFFEPRIAHGDISPFKHVYLRPDGRLALIDFENFTSTGARYFDAAWNYTRLYSFASTTDIPRYFLGEFIKRSEPAEHKLEQLFAVLMQRTLGMQKDAVSNFKDKDVDYRDRAKELLGLVLQNDLQLLHAGSAANQTSNRTIKAIIFDCFGVLNIEGFDAFRTKYVKPGQLDAANQAMNQLNVGQIDYDEFLKQLEELTGASSNEILAELDKNVPNKPLFDFIRTELKPCYKIGIVSNSGSDRIDEMFAKADVELFDDIVLSYKFGIIKPDPRIFDLAASRLGVKIDECVMVDDKQKHAEGARQAGMQAVLYQNFEQMKAELEQLITPGSNN